MNQEILAMNDLENMKKAEEVKEEQTAPLIDFSKTEESPDKFDEKAELIHKYYSEKIFSKVVQLLFGIFCIFMTVHTGAFGLVLFIAAIFYLIPDSLTKLVVFLKRYKHYKDYVEADDYHVDNHYLQIVLKEFMKNKKKDN